MSYTDFYVRKLNQLVGYTVVGTVRSPEDEFGYEFFGLNLMNFKTKRKCVLWILADDEGNGPGSFEIDVEPEDNQIT